MPSAPSRPRLSSRTRAAGASVSVLPSKCHCDLHQNCPPFPKLPWSDPTSPTPAGSRWLYPGSRVPAGPWERPSAWRGRTPGAGTPALLGAERSPVKTHSPSQLSFFWERCPLVRVPRWPQAALPTARGMPSPPLPAQQERPVSSELGLTRFPVVPAASACSGASFTFSSRGWMASFHQREVRGAEGEGSPSLICSPAAPFQGPAPIFLACSMLLEHETAPRGGEPTPAQGASPSGDGSSLPHPQPLLWLERPSLLCRHLTRTRPPQNRSFQRMPPLHTGG